MTTIVTIAGSPAQYSRSAAILEYASALLELRGIRSSAINVRELPAKDLLFGRASNPAIQRAVEQIQGADALVIATPVYKAAYSGLLKIFLDLLPQTALENKALLPIATGGTLAHMLAITYALKPVLAALGAQHILNGVYIVDSQLQSIDGQSYLLDAESQQRLARSIDLLLRAVQQDPARLDTLVALPLSR